MHHNNSQLVNNSRRMAFCKAIFAYRYACRRFCIALLYDAHALMDVADINLAVLAWCIQRAGSEQTKFTSEIHRDVLQNRQNPAPMKLIPIDTNAKAFAYICSGLTVQKLKSKSIYNRGTTKLVWHSVTLKLDWAFIQGGLTQHVLRRN